ncbi:hypothetical protein [Limnohabitans planktonicus]|uniref:Uncharacterized protein n=1 Tax=Limnohabitans planktonicus II-D5 TaxID=1293045 RepID=A0A2T7UDT8_9BURK|nr:hypothetical protein [Limnohabitans planktonicus]PVE42859.1 hypothetical protein H663_010145 [Limnohabitans planktonicus II-D5]|eukprot:gene8636-10227_t
MSIFNSIKKAASELVSKPISIPINQDTINAAIAKAISDENDVKEVTVTLRDAWFETYSKLGTGLGDLNVTANFEIQSFVINANTQSIELRLKDKPELNAENRLASVALRVVDGLLSALFGTSLLVRKLNAKDGVRVEGNVITIDLAKLGVLGLLRESAHNRGGMIGEGLLSWGLASFSDRLSIQGMNCHEGKISVLLKVE